MKLPTKASASGQVTQQEQENLAVAYQESCEAMKTKTYAYHTPRSARSSGSAP